MVRHGSFFWYDVMTSDTVAGTKFYRNVVGWDAADSGTPDHNYTLFSVGGRSVAGLMAIPPEAGPEARPVWMGYVAVDDVDVTAARIAAEGGAIHRPPADIPGVIRFAVVADPQGAVFLIARGLIDDAPPAPPPGAPGTIGWHELYAGDWESVFPFYAKLFGWTKDQAIDMGPAGTYQLFKAGDGAPAGGMMTKPASVPRPYWGFYFNVTGLEAAVARLTQAGGRVLHGPIQVPGGQWIVQAMDPQGAIFALVSTEK